MGKDLADPSSGLVKVGVGKTTNFVENGENKPFKVASKEHGVLIAEPRHDLKNSPGYVAPSYPMDNKPGNHVTQYRSGHFVEFDQTEGEERIRVGHKSGSYAQMNKDGSIQIRTVAKDGKGGDAYLAVDKDFNLKIAGNFNVHVAKGEIRFKTAGAAYVETGDLNIKTNGNVKWNTSGNVNWEVDGNYTLKASTIDFNP